jgi:transposase
MLIQLKKHDGCLSRRKLSVMLGICPDSVQAWRKIYIDGGINSLITHGRGGSVSVLFGEAEHDFLESALSNPENGIQGYAELKRIMDHHFDFNFKYSTLLGYCQRNFKTKIKSSRNRHVNRDEETVEDFKKTLLPVSKRSAKPQKIRTLRSRCGLKTKAVSDSLPKTEKY